MVEYGDALASEHTLADSPCGSCSFTTKHSMLLPQINALHVCLISAEEAAQLRSAWVPVYFKIQYPLPRPPSTGRLHSRRRRHCSVKNPHSPRPAELRYIACTIAYPSSGCAVEKKKGVRVTRLLPQTRELPTRRWSSERRVGWRPFQQTQEGTNGVFPTSTMVRRRQLKKPLCWWQHSVRQSI